MARPLITPDEAMRLGADEALIFTSGRPAIRAMKLRYYVDPSFKRLAEIAPPPKSDRIEDASAIADCDEPHDHTRSEAPEQKMPEQRPAIHAATGKPRHVKPVPVAQLSFLKFAVESGNGAADSPKEEGVKERLL